MKIKKRKAFISLYWLNLNRHVVKAELQVLMSALRNWKNWRWTQLCLVFAPPPRIHVWSSSSVSASPLGEEKTKRWKCKAEEKTFLHSCHPHLFDFLSLSPCSIRLLVFCLELWATDNHDIIMTAQCPNVSKTSHLDCRLNGLWSFEVHPNTNIRHVCFLSPT